MLKLLLCGDVMAGRGGQLLAAPSDPVLYDSYAHSAGTYLRLAEQASGPIPSRVEASYIWGDALAELERQKPDLRMINLETSISPGGHPWK